MNTKKIIPFLLLLTIPSVLFAARPSINVLNTRVNQLEAENNAQQAEIDALDSRVTELETGDIKGVITICGVAEADVQIYAPGTSFSAATDGSGNFRISHVREGSYSLSINKGGSSIGTVGQITILKKQIVDIGTNDYCSLNVGENCSSDTQCASGYCISGACSDLSSDPNNCGALGNACLPNEICGSGVCVDLSSDPNNCGVLNNVCPPLSACISGACSDLSSDPNNCGALGNACLPNEICGSGVCVDLSSDPNNCGVLDNVCPPLSACTSGVCFDLSSNPNNCGTLGNACLPNEICGNGVCIDLSSDLNNCGALGDVCSPGDNCVSGACTTPP